MFRPIAISLSPNTNSKDVFLVLKIIFSPWRWHQINQIKKLEAEFRQFFKVKYAASFNSGRVAQYALLKAAGIQKGDEVLVPAFTCVVVPNSALWLGAKPIYVDLKKETLNMDPEDLKRKISSRSKAIIVQHTFGKPAQINQIKKIAQKNKLLLIEDCAHSLGAKHKNQKLGTFGQAAFFSFGRDKVISSVFGGMAITNDDRIGKKLLRIQSQIKFPSHFWIFQQLFHPLSFTLILPLYNFFHLGKVILVIFQKLRFLSRAVGDQEKKSLKPSHFSARLPVSLATLALSQFQRLKGFNHKRKKIAQIYRKELKLKKIKHLPVVPGEIYMRYPVISDQAKEIYKDAKKRGILLGDWYQNVVDPKGVNLKAAGYAWGSCPVAEKIAPKVLNLPTYPRMKEEDARKVVKVIAQFVAPQCE